MKRLADKGGMWSEKEETVITQISDVREVADGPLSEMDMTEGAIGLDSKLKSSVLAMES